VTLPTNQKKQLQSPKPCRHYDTEKFSLSQKVKL
jgi:hypothetical protein